MAWVRIDDQVPRHPKMVKAGNSACWLWVCGLAYCQSQLSDGFIPDNVVTLLQPERNAKALAVRLINAGLWERVDGGYNVHDYLDFNESSDVVKAKRKADRDRKFRTESGRNENNSSRIPDVRARASHPIPSHPESTNNKPERETGVVQGNGNGSQAPKDPFLSDEITARAAKFIERYQVLYPERRNGARYAVRETRDYAAAVRLCQTWPDDARLEKLAILFLTTDNKFADEGSRTIPQFLALASWCDGKLADWEKTHAG